MEKIEAEYYSIGLFENQCIITIDNIIKVNKEINGTKPTIEYINGFIDGFIDGIKMLYPDILIYNKGEVRKDR